MMFKEAYKPVDRIAFIGYVDFRGLLGNRYESHYSSYSVQFQQSSKKICIYLKNIRILTMNFSENSLKYLVPFGFNFVKQIKINQKSIDELENKEVE